MLKHENSLVWHREVLGWINKYSGIDGGGDEEEEKDGKGAGLAAKTEGLSVR